MSLSFRIVFFIIAFLIMHLHAAQYVLSPSDDWFSIVTGAGLQPGDEVILTSGVYTSLNSINIGHQGTEQNPITIRAAEGANVVFTHDEYHNVLQLTGARHLIIKGLEITGGSMGIRIFQNAQGDHAKFITVEDCYIHDTREAAITANHTNQTYEGMIFRGNEITRTGGTGEGFYLGANFNQAQFYNGIIENNYIHHLKGTNIYGNTIVQGDGIEIKEGSYNNIIRNNVIHDVNYAGIVVYGTAGNGGNNIISGNVIWNCDDNAIQAASDAEIYNNIVFSTQYDGIHSRYHQNSIPGNIKILHNTIINNAGTYGIRLSEANITGDIVVANNAIYASNPSKGMYLYAPTQGSYELVSSGNVVLDINQVDVANKNFFPNMLISGVDPTYALTYDFNGNSRDILSVGAYTYSSTGNPGWAITEGFKSLNATAIPETSSIITLLLGIFTILSIKNKSKK